MNCPFCQHLESQVVDTRQSTYNHIPGIRRRRTCLQCKKRFSSFEMTIHDLEAVEPATLDGILQQIIKVFKDAPRTNYKAPSAPLALIEDIVSDVNSKTPKSGLKTLPGSNGNVTLAPTPTKKDIQQALQRARQKIARGLDELDASEFDDSDFD